MMARIGVVASNYHMGRVKVKEKKQLNCRIDVKVADEIHAEIARLYKDGEIITLNDWIEEAAKAKLVERYSTPRPTDITPVNVHSAGLNGGRFGSKSAELAAKFAHLGVTTLAKIEDAPVIYKDESPTLEVIAVERNPDWLKLYTSMEEMDATEAKYTFDQAIGDRKLPPGFLKMPRNVQLKTIKAMYP